MGKFKHDEKDKSIFYQLKDRLKTESMCYWVLWKYAPEHLPDKCETFTDLQNKYKCFANLTEAKCERYAMSDKVQSAIKWLLKQQNTKKLADLYNKYYELAMDGNVQAFKAFIDFQKEMFADETENELRDILRGTDLSEMDSEPSEDEIDMGLD